MTTQETAGAAQAQAEEIDKLARMAGQIADFFKSYPEEAAARSVAEHINQFWSWRMRERFLDAFGPADGRLSPLLRKAAPLIRRRQSRASPP